MKKPFYLFIFIGLLCLKFTAQVNFKAIGTTKTGRKHLSSQAKPSSPQAVIANLSTYGYRASMTQTLDLSISITNMDDEYADSVSITFPAGITPISTPDLTFPTIDSNGGLETYNGINGQTISWGKDNNDLYGGIFGSNLNFKVVVNIGAISGVQTGTFHVSGDGYFQINQASDYDGTFQISPKLPVDLRVTHFLIPDNGCLSGTTENIEIWMRNDGYNAATGGVNLTYKVNANATVAESSSLTIAPDDTLKYVFNTTSNFLPLGTYTVTGSGTNALDGNSANNQTLKYTTSYPKNSLPYQTGFEASPVSDLLFWTKEDLDSPYTWDTTSLLARTGSSCMRMLENSQNTCDDWLYSSCLNLQSGKTYALTYWTRLTSGYVGSLGISIGLSPNSFAMGQQTLRPISPLIDNSTWTKDSISFSVTSSDIYHIGFEAVNTTQEIIALRLDDISIVDVSGPTGIGNIIMDEISVYPNPASETLNIYSPNTFLNIDIYNIMGQNIYSSKTSSLGQNKINISTFTPGHYTAKLSNDRNVFYKHIIIESK